MKAAGTSGPTGGGAPEPILRVGDAVALVLGIVIGAGIFRAPSAVAANAPDNGLVIGVWVAGGVVSLAGAMCYAELAATYPSAGGDYHFLTRAFGRAAAFLFGWARLTVIPTGSVALLGFTFGDYVAAVAGAPSASPIFAAAMIVAIAAVNVVGLTVARTTQNVLSALLVAGLVAVIATGLLVAPAGAGAPVRRDDAQLGRALVFVLLAYGGWNEAAYVSTEVRGGSRRMAAALLSSIAIVTVLYTLANVAYLRGLGLGAVQQSKAVAADLMSRAFGGAGASAIAAIVALSTLTSVNATLLMGSRMAWAFGRDFPLFAPLGRWSRRASSPIAAVLFQTAVALGLVAIGTAWRTGFESMVAYTAPVFWLFFLLSGLSLFVLRWKDPRADRPFRVPLYPLTPALFCAGCAYLLWSSVLYAGPGALLGLAVLGAGLVPLWLSMRKVSAEEPAAA